MTQHEVFLKNTSEATRKVKRNLICLESVVNHDEWRHSIVNYRNPYHWLREKNEFKATFGTNGIRGIESAIVSTIAWERRQRTLRERRNICVFSPYSFWVSLWTLESEVRE